MNNKEAIEFGKSQLEMFGADSKMNEFIQLAIKAIEERPMGKWEYTDGRWGLGDWRCSKCCDYSNKDTHYCPNCGADMRGDICIQ